MPEIKALFHKNDNAVRDFEQMFAEQFEAADAVAFPHGRSALWAFLKAVGIQNKEIIIPAYTCSVVAHAVTLSGNEPRFVDIKLSDYNMDLEEVRRKITRDTGAVIGTHIFGYPLDIDELESMVRDAENRYGHKIWLIQDCAHSFGARWKGRLVGRSGDLALYGLNISKTMTSIFGGMLTFNDAELAHQIRQWRDANFRKPKKLKSLSHRTYLAATKIAFSETVYGITYWLQNRTPILDGLTKSYHLDDRIVFPPDYLDQMLPVDANVGIAQLKKYENNIQRRIQNAVLYDQKLNGQPNLILPPLIDGATYSHYVARVRNRKAFIDHAARNGFQLGELIQYSIPNLNSYLDLSEAYPNSALASRSTINLPVGPTVTAENIECICNAISTCKD
jgi:dTDP-4-amino-4,6-dideoxygalactose transaminase